MGEVTTGATAEREERPDDLIAEAERLCALAEQHDAKATPGPFEMFLIGPSWMRRFEIARPMHGDDPYVATFDTDVDAKIYIEARAAWPALAKATRALLAENARLRKIVETTAAKDAEIAPEWSAQHVLWEARKAAGIPLGISIIETCREIRRLRAALRAAEEQQANIDQHAPDDGPVDWKPRAEDGEYFPLLDRALAWAERAGDGYVRRLVLSLAEDLALEARQTKAAARARKASETNR